MCGKLILDATPHPTKEQVVRSNTMVEVVRSNFSSKLHSFSQLIRRCDFLALDLEFTGLHTSKRQTVNSSDTHQVRYLKVKDSASNFQMLQLGVSLFTWIPHQTPRNTENRSSSIGSSDTESDIEDTKETRASTTTKAGFWEVHPFNIFVMPSGHVKEQATFLCEASAMKFLSGNHFDFNKCIADGVPYLSHAEHEEASASREKHIRASAQNDMKSTININNIRQCKYPVPRNK